MLNQLSSWVFGLAVMGVWQSPAQALSDEEKKSTCQELALIVLPVQRATAIDRCIEFATNDCDRMERSFMENCRDISHFDNAIKYDIERGSSGSCEAAIIKRNTQRDLCESLRRECRETKIPLGGGGAEATCTSFRNEDNKKFCGEIERHAKRISATETEERQKCEKLTGKSFTAQSTGAVATGSTKASTKSAPTARVATGTTQPKKPIQKSN